MRNLMRLMFAVLALQMFFIPVGQAENATGAKAVTVYKSPTCHCCSAWIKHLRSANFDVQAHDLEQSQLRAIKSRNGIQKKYASCHTAKIGGYVIEGHVPAKEVQRLLDTKPDGAIGLSVPGMPVGSPGMEVGDRKEPYDVLLLKADGTSEVFARYHQNSE